MCKLYCKRTEFKVIEDDIDGLGFVLIECISCSCQKFVYGTYNGNFMYKNHDYRNTRAHTKNHFNPTDGSFVISSGDRNEQHKIHKSQAEGSMPTFQVDCNNCNENISESFDSI